MAARGPKPTDGPTVFRGQAMTDWVEVENVPFEDAPELPERTPLAIIEDGVQMWINREWPKETLRKWRAWSQMPHCALWTESDWEYLFDCLEIDAAWKENTSRVGLGTELRTREQRLGITAEDRRNLRIRYVEPKAPKPALKIVTDNFEDL